MRVLAVEPQRGARTINDSGDISRTSALHVKDEVPIAEYASIFRGALSLIFTSVTPLAVMTTYAALAILDRATIDRVLAAVAGSLLFAGVARWVWLRSLGHYTGAGC